MLGVGGVSLDMVYILDQKNMQEVHLLFIGFSLLDLFGRAILVSWVI